MLYTYICILTQLKSSWSRETISIPLADPVVLHLQSNFFSVVEGTATVAVCVVADNPADIGGRTILVTVTATPGSAQG